MKYTDKTVAKLTRKKKKAKGQKTASGIRGDVAAALRDRKDNKETLRPLYANKFNEIHKFFEKQKQKLMRGQII